MAFLVTVQLLPSDLQVLLRALVDVNRYQIKPIQIRSYQILRALGYYP